MKTSKLEDIFQYPSQGLDRLDAAENAFFARELEYIIPELFEVTYSRINSRMIFPIDRGAGPAAETITYRQFDKTGLAKVISDYASDIPLVNVEGVEFTGRIRSIAIGAKWSIQEIRASAMAGRPLDRQQAEAAREAMLREENRVAFFGDAAYGLVGLFTDTNVPRVAAPGGVWSGKTSAQILADMHNCANAIVENTGDIEVPNTLLLPTEQFNFIASTNAGTGTDTTILRYFLNNNPYITEVMNVRAGCPSTSRFLSTCTRESKQCLSLRLPTTTRAFCVSGPRATSGSVSAPARTRSRKPAGTPLSRAPRPCKTG